MIDIYYPEKMINIIQKHKYIFIPKKVPNNQKYLKLHHKYYYSEFVSECYFKVIEYYEEKDLVHKLEMVLQEME